MTRFSSNWQDRGRRRRCRFGSALFFLVTLSPLFSAPARPTSVEITTITPDEERYYHGWPTVARLSNGQLMVVWSGGRDAHVCPFGRVESMTSSDNGVTWSWPRVILDSPIDDRDAGILETARGTLLLSTFGSIGYRKDGRLERYGQQPENWKRATRGVSDDVAINLAGAKLMRSVDRGLTWSPPQDMPVNSPHGPIQLKDGRLLYPGVSPVGLGLDFKPDEREVGAWQSTDDGSTWTLAGRIPLRPSDQIIDYHELHGVEAADGTLVVMIRSHAKGGPREMLQTDSHDGGKTWTTPRSLGLQGYPPHLIRLKDGRLLLSYDHRIAPYGVQVRFSDNHGASWSEPVIITENAEKLDQGYPSTVQLDDHIFLSVWYEVPPGKKKAVLKQARWTAQK